MKLAILFALSLLSFNSMAQTLNAAPMATPTKAPVKKVDLSNLKEVYTDSYTEKSKELRQYFTTKIKEIEDSYILLGFLEKNRSKKSIQIRELTDFVLSLPSEKRKKVIAEIVELKKITKQPSVPYVLYTDKGANFNNRFDIPQGLAPEKIVKFYTTGEVQIINALILLDFAADKGLDPYGVYYNRKKELFNFRQDISMLSFSELHWQLVVSKWEKDLYKVLFEKIRIEVAELKEEMEEGYKKAEASLFIPKEVLENKSQILFALNTCSYSQHTVNVEGTVMKYEDYAFLHMKELIKYLNKESSIAFGYVEGNRYGFTRLKNKEELDVLFEGKNYFIDFLGNSLKPNLIKSGTGDNENISSLYKATQKSNMNFNYVLFFTDGYGSTGNDISVVSNASAKFLFKGMCPECGTYDNYVSKVPKEGKDIVLNN